MTPIKEILAKVYPVTNIVMGCYIGYPQIHTLKDAMTKIQMSFYWLQEADVELKKELGIEEEDGKMEKPVSPTMISPIDQMEFIKSNLNQITKDLFDYKEDVPSTVSIKQKLDAGYFNLKEAAYATEISIMYYKQLQTLNGE